MTPAKKKPLKTCRICRKPKSAKPFVTVKGTKVNLCTRCLDENYNTHPCPSCESKGFLVEYAR